MQSTGEQPRIPLFIRFMLSTFYNLIYEHSGEQSSFEVR